MRGSIIKRGNSYRIRVSLGKDPVTGKYNSYFETFRGSKPEADTRLNELIHQFNQGGLVKSGKTTVGEHLTRWIEDYAETNLSPTTAKGYRTAVKQHLIPALGKVPLNKLRPEMLQKYVKDTLEKGRVSGEGGLSARSVRHHVVVLHTALEQAVKFGLIAHNPVVGVKMPRLERHELKTLSEVDLSRFLEMSRSTPYYALFYTALFTGMRRSEILALRWKDIDLDMLQVSVNRSLHVVKGKVIYRQPKSERSRRLIALTPSNAIVLKEHKESQNLLRKSLGLDGISQDDLVFSRYDGEPLHPDTATKNWERLVNKAGLSGVRFHDARHTHATLMLKQGVHPKIVQERLGHSSIQLTLDTYSHVSPGLQQSAAKAFDGAVLKNREVIEKLSET